MAVISTNKPCLRKAKNQLEKHQMGFDGEHIGEVVLRRLGYKGVKLTSHKSKFDILTSREAWEIKTVGRDAVDKKMSVKARQKLEKLAWAKKNKRRPKSMMVVVNDSAEVYIRDGLGKFRPGGMKKVRTFKDWRKEVGHGRTERLVEGRPAPIFVPAKTIKEAERWVKKNIEGVDNVSFKGFGLEQVNDIMKELSILQGKYGRLGRLNQIESVVIKDFGFAARMQAGRNLQIRIDQISAHHTRLVEAGIWKSKKGLAGLVDHEIGHTMTPDIFTQKGEFTKFGRRLDAFFEKNKMRIRNEMTDYAATKRHEFVAEAWSMREADTAPKWVLDWLRKEGI